MSTRVVTYLQTWENRNSTLDVGDWNHWINVCLAPGQSSSVNSMLPLISILIAHIAILGSTLHWEPVERNEATHGVRPVLNMCGAWLSEDVEENESDPNMLVMMWVQIELTSRKPSRPIILNP